MAKFTTSCHRHQCTPQHNTAQHGIALSACRKASSVRINSSRHFSAFNYDCSYCSCCCCCCFFYFCINTVAIPTVAAAVITHIVVVVVVVVVAQLRRKAPTPTLTHIHIHLLFLSEIKLRLPFCLQIMINKNKANYAHSPHKCAVKASGYSFQSFTAIELNLFQLCIR